MAKVVYIEWLDGTSATEIVGVYENDVEAYEARENADYKLVKEGHDTFDEVRVWVEDIDITRDEAITNFEISLVKYALAGRPVVVRCGLADKIESILRKFLVD